jgi:hypothetical protein
LDLTQQRYEERKQRRELDAQMNRDQGNREDKFEMTADEEDTEEQDQWLAYLFDDKPLPVESGKGGAIADEDSDVDTRSIWSEIQSRRGR